MTKKTDKKFTVGISYEENLKGLEETYKNEVLPTLKGNSKELTKPYVTHQEPILTVAQKAHLNCKSPI